MAKIISICSNCKKITGEQENPDPTVTKDFESHGICKKCAHDLYGVELPEETDPPTEPPVDGKKK